MDGSIHRTSQHIAKRVWTATDTQSADFHCEVEVLVFGFICRISWHFPGLNIRNGDVCTTGDATSICKGALTLEGYSVRFAEELQKLGSVDTRLAALESDAVEVGQAVSHLEGHLETVKEVEAAVAALEATAVDTSFF